MLIKCGWQYKNEIGGSRVVKRELGVIHAAYKRVENNPLTLLRPFKLLKKSARGIELAREARSILLQRPDLNDLFGIQNINSHCIIQDEMISVRTALGCSTVSDAKIITAYFEFVTLMIKHGLFEYTFNFLDNYGFNAAGHIRLIDVGEFSLSRDDLIAKIDRGETKPKNLTVFKEKSLIGQFLSLQSCVYEKGRVLALWQSLPQTSNLSACSILPA